MQCIRMRRIQIRRLKKRCLQQWKMLFSGPCSLKAGCVWTLLGDAVAMALVVALAALGTLAYGLC